MQAVGLGFGLAAFSLVVERPARSEWHAGNEDPSTTEARELSVYYSGCDEARRAGAASIYQGEPSYLEGMNGDGDSVACEPYPR